MSAYVLVHGGFAGGYQWREVASLLRYSGHDVYTPTLTGLGERVHLAHPDVDLDLHVQDILGVLKYEKLSDVTLAGHSYAGMVISGVAEQSAERIKHLVYIDAFVPHDGESLWDIFAAHLPAPVLEAMNQAIRDVGEGWRLPPPAKRTDGVDFPEGTPQPIKTMMQGLTIRDRKAALLPRTYIYCSENAPGWVFRPVIAACGERARETGWTYYELPTSHAVFATMPRELTEILLTLT